MIPWFSRNWFLCGLLGVALITALDTHEWTVGLGRYLKSLNGPDVVIVLIFFISGVVLEADQIKSGLVDVKATLTALVIIFVLSPAVAWIMGFLPLNMHILTGLFIVAVMPSTLSSGVVMTNAAGGNMAHALTVTILSNIMAVFTIPVTLGFLLSDGSGSRSIEIDKIAIVVKIGLLVLAPLLIGMWIRLKTSGLQIGARTRLQGVNQALILAMVWMAISQGRTTLVSNLGALLPIVGVAFCFHLALILLGLLLVKTFNIGRGRRESVILMGGQKTLPLSVILQISLFPDYGLALVFCATHHIVHLVMDGYLVKRLGSWK
jgi:sodium/bile acid cotransporter 7